MGAFESLREDDLRRGAAGLSEHSSAWRAFYGREDLDRKLNLMLDEIQDLVSEGRVEQIFVHDRDCPTCRESLPKFGMVSGALQGRLSNYASAEVELGQQVTLPGASGSVTGMEIYKLFREDTKGVPFVIQNARVSSGGGESRFEPSERFFVVFVGKLDPFRFLATAFNIDNKRIS
jgi:hypothetical protein